MHVDCPLLVAFVTDPALARVLERVMRDGRLLLSGVPKAFVDLASREEPNGVLIDLSVARLDVEALVPAVVARLGRVPVLLYTPLDHRRAGDVLRIAQSFPTSVILQGHDDVARGVARFLRDGLGLTAATALVNELADDMHTHPQWIVRHCLARATPSPTVPELASIAGASVRTFGRHIRDTCDMSPQEVLLLSRLLLAAAILHVTRLSVSQVAEAVGDADASSLSRAMKYHFGWRCAQLRERGSFSRFVQSLRARYPRWFAC